MIHPADAGKMGIVDGILCEIGNDRGTVVLHALHFGGLQPGVLVVESLWPNHSFVGGIGINSLTGADPVAPIGGVAFHDNAVWIKVYEQE
jgi:anaerobic selenocysteine-containing dehydrogenase